MAESASHAGLVTALVAFAAAEFGGLSNICVRHDAVRPLRGERPPRINGYVPDLYAVDVPTTAVLVGEAKTRADLETAHTRIQLDAFLCFLAQTPNGVFVLSVPLTAGATARSMLLSSSRPYSAAQTRMVVLDGLGVRVL
ncbi:hypothetical protein HFN97_20575 [Rhizobium laguerreae]|uniref:hypothetical protein n=1 Tax=Rhizobium TaxID=379 RepID=UPI001C91CDF7|nr:MULTISPECIES: hypothetical protein [Rhizobium]MBY2941838.1 hypothetical protein [Rhizobium leguminosarum]MBY3360193.1 hypothetical protein [Rhizobium laguerreae]